MSDQQRGIRALGELPPGPFRYITTARADEHEGRGHVYICDATGKKIASLWGAADTKLAMAAFIIEARAALSRDE